MMKGCKNDVHFIHSLEWSMGTFDGIQDLIGEKASSRQQRWSCLEHRVKRESYKNESLAALLI